MSDDSCRRRNRRVATRARREADIAAECLAEAVAHPEERAAQVERIYAAIPPAKRRAAGLTYEHVRLVLEALR